MTNKEISNKAIDIIRLNQMYLSNDIKIHLFKNEINEVMKDMSLEDLLILGCTLSALADNTEKTLQK